MIWDDLQNNAKALREVTEEKLRVTKEVAEIRIQIAAIGKRLPELYRDLGKSAYDYFCKDKNNEDEMTDQIEAISALLEKEKELRGDLGKYTQKK